MKRNVNPLIECDQVRPCVPECIRLFMGDSGSKLVVSHLFRLYPTIFPLTQFTWSHDRNSCTEIELSSSFFGISV